MPNKLALITGAALRDRWRWARQHLYAILILSPLVGGMTYLTAARVASYAPEWGGVSPPAALALFWLAEVALVGLSMSRASAELFHLRRPESLHDALPVAPETHLHAALATRAARTAAVGAVALVARTVAGEGSTLAPEIFPPLALFVFVGALAEVLAALEWVHWGHRRDAAHALLAVVVLAPTFAVAGTLLALVVRPSLLAGDVRPWLLPAAFLWGLALYALTRALHARWRASDIEYANRLRETGRRGIGGAGWLGRLGGRAVAELVRRDLRLTRRAFSSAVYVSWTLAALSLLAFAVASATGLLPPKAVLPPGSGGGFFETTLLVPVVAAKVACVLAAASLAAVVPVLVAHQLPHLWLERATRATGEELWRAKVWFARTVAAPAPVAAWLLAVLTGAVPAPYAPLLLLECVWLWWLVSSTAGVLAFEMAEQPGLALVLMLFAGLSVGLLTAWLWPLGLLAGMVSDQAAMRGAHRAHVLMTAEGD